jgi:propanediol dehydratase small subunit
VKQCAEAQVAAMAHKRSANFERSAEIVALPENRPDFILDCAMDIV